MNPPRAITITPQTAALGVELDAQRVTRLALSAALRSNGAFTDEEAALWERTVDSIGKLSAQIRRMTIERGQTNG